MFTKSPLLGSLNDGAWFLSLRVVIQGFSTMYKLWHLRFLKSWNKGKTHFFFTQDVSLVELIRHKNGCELLEHKNGFINREKAN